PRPRGRRRRRAQVVEEPGHRPFLALDLDRDSTGSVQHGTAEPVSPRQAIDEGAEADPLDDPFDRDDAPPDPFDVARERARRDHEPPPRPVVAGEPGARSGGVFLTGRYQPRGTASSTAAAQPRKFKAPGPAARRLH